MATTFTAEQQAQIDVANAMETMRHANQMEYQTRMNKLETIRLAKETLIENARSKPVDARDVSAADITAFADSLMASINA
jgi:hypothetical protein